VDAFAEEVVDSINAIAGEHAGSRVAHAKGTLMAGTFTPSDSGLTTAAHMSGDPVPVTARFSNGGGNPSTPDWEREGRGLALKFYLPDGTRTDIVGLSLPRFFVRTPEHFLEFTKARRPDPETGEPNMEKVGAFVAAHPECVPAIQAALSAEPPESYATCVYNSIHSFRWTDPEGTSRWVRYRFEPEAGERTISSEEAKERGPDYLQEEIAGRGASFRLMVVIAGEDDEVHDATVEWPAERESVEAGRLEITGPDTERERDGDILVFDPTRVTDGVELTDDPIPRFRSRAYSVSVEERAGVARPAELDPRP
jgi:catalase